MFAARKTDAIVCRNGHVNGHLKRDILTNGTIKAEDIGFISTEIAKNFRTTPPLGHDCLQCGESITQYRDGVYEVRIARGWAII
jgi:hypothetical protein